jgi:hypothetical protein
MVELPVDHVDVTVKHQGIRVEFARAIAHLSREDGSAQGQEE